MKIGFDFRMGGVRHGGIGRYAEELLLRLLAQNLNDEFVIFYNDSILPDSLDLIDRHNNAKLVKVAARHYSMAEQWQFLRVLNRLKLDLVHFPNFNHPIFYKGKFVVTIHDLIHHKLSGHKPSHFLHFLAYKKVMKHAVEKSAAIITPSNASKIQILEYIKTFNSVAAYNFEDKISVIYEGAVVAPAAVTAYTAQVKKRYFLHRPYFLFVGTLERKKMVPLLAKAFDIFIEKFKMDMDLVIVGKVDSHYPEEREKILSIKNKDRLVLTGFTPEVDLRALYAGAYAYISLSPHEGFGLPGVDALVLGLPIITVNVPVANEIYDSGALYAEVGSAEDAAEKMYLLARDAKFYQRQAKMALIRGQFFSWEKAAAETLMVYKHAFQS